MKTLLPSLLAIGTLYASGCKYQDIHECDPDLQLAIDSTIIYGIDSEIYEITTRVHEEVPESERLVSTLQVLDTMLADEVYCGIPFESAEEDVDIQGTYIDFQERVVIEENTLQFLVDFYEFDEAKRVLDLYSEDSNGNYFLDKEKIKSHLREQECLSMGFVKLMADLRDLYHVFSRVGDTLFHEYTHMTLHQEGFPYVHEDQLSDHLVNEHGWAVRDVMMDEISPAIELALEAYDEVKEDRE